MRKDLSPSQQAVQACHAIIESFRNSIIPLDGNHPHLVICEVKGLPQLIKVIDKLKSISIKHSFFIEPDLDNTLTAVSTEPVSQELRKHFKKFQLLNLGEHYEIYS